MSPANYTWGGQQTFQIVGTQLHEDTLRIESNYRKQERTLTLILPTLCITYADMKFSNTIGGTQPPYPASQAYASYFDPPIVLNGPDEIEKLTWIRGARRVTISRDKTVVEWWMGDTLVIPRLRIEQKKPLQVQMDVPVVPIDLHQELSIQVKQFADGRHIGGVRIEKRHPDWKPEEQLHRYDLWVQVINAATLQPIPEAALKIFHWDPRLPTPSGNGGMRFVLQRFTSGAGVVHEPGRPSDELEAVLLARPGWASAARCFRPLPGQPVRIHLRTWQLKKDARPYTWRTGDTLENIALLTGFSPQTILRQNKLKSPTQLKRGKIIQLPCYTASYWLGGNDTPEQVVTAFGYKGVEEITKLNKGWSRAGLDGSRAIRLIGWHFVYARPGDTLKNLDKQFKLPAGACRIVGQVYHPDPRLPYESEVIAVPTEEFAKKHRRKR
jgi:hypothetical protein